MNILSHLGMTRKRRTRKVFEPFIAYSSSWVRANASGIVRNLVHIGDQVKRGDVLAEIGTPFGDVVGLVKASRSGIVIGKQNIPLVQEGEAMFNVANFKEDDEDVADQIESLNEALIPEYDVALGDRNII